MSMKIRHRRSTELRQYMVSLTLSDTEDPSDVVHNNLVQVSSLIYKHDNGKVSTWRNLTRVETHLHHTRQS